MMWFREICFYACWGLCTVESLSRWQELISHAIVGWHVLHFSNHNDLAIWRSLTYLIRLQINSLQWRHMSILAYQITGNQIVFNHLLRQRSTYLSSVLLTLCEENPMVTSGISTERASNSESVSMALVVCCARYDRTKVFYQRHNC